MSVKEIDLILKNEPGQLSLVSDILGSNGISIIAFYAYSVGGEGGLKFIANDPDRAITVLQSRGYKMDVAEVIACETPNHPGGFNAILKSLKEAGINVDYVYPCLSSQTTNGTAILILGVASQDREKTLSVLRENWINVVDEDLYRS